MRGIGKWLVASAGAWLFRRGVVEARAALFLWSAAAVVLTLGAWIVATLLVRDAVSIDAVEGLRPATRRFR